MTHHAPDSFATPRPSLSMFDVYSGYIVTQGHNALRNVVIWERVMRGIGIAAILAVAALWLLPDAATGPQVVPMKLVLSGVLGGMAGLLFWAARVRPQYESQVDLIHGELRQVMRASNGIERLMMRVPFARVSGVYVKVNRAMPGASCLFMDVDGVETPVLLGVGEDAALGSVHRRLSDDLAKARTMPHPPLPTPETGRRLPGMQAA